MHKFEQNIAEEFGDVVIAYSELQVGDEVGSGAYGVVKKGTYRKTPVAIKQLIASAVKADQLEEFKAEAALMKKLPPHPNVVSKMKNENIKSFFITK